MRKNNPEAELQRACVAWFRLQYPDQAALLFMVPNDAFLQGNGGVRARKGGEMKKMGMVAGAPDLMLLSPAGAVAIELKRPDGKGRQSPAQKEWQRQAEGLGYEYYLIDSVDDFMRIVNEKMQGK